jgi:transposase
MGILHVGIDWGNRNSELFGLTEDGEVLGARIASLDEGAWRETLEGWSQRFEIHAAFEAGPQYEWLHDLLGEYCVQVTMVDPMQFAMITRSMKKTDRTDAQRLAEGVRRGDLPKVEVPEKRMRRDRRLVRFVHWHSRRMGSVKGRLRSLLVTYRLESPWKDVLGKSGRRWLEDVAKPRMDDQGRLIVDMLVEQAGILAAQRAKLDAEVVERLKGYDAEEVRILDSVPGFGPLTILALLCMIAGIQRFPRAKELASYFGVCGRVYQSGQTLRLGAMTKRGNATVRWLLSQALTGLHRCDPRARKRYLRLRRKKPVGVARGAQVRWLVSIVWHLLTKREAYRIGGTKRQEQTERVA